MSLAVQRLREIGIRTALGAPGERVVLLFFRGGLGLSLTGLLLGLPLSVLALRQVSVGLPTSNALLGAAIAGVVLAVTCLATWLPARRAARGDPLAALRAD